MEPMFELRYIPEKKNMAAFYRKVLGPRPAVLIIGGIFMALILIAAVAEGFWQDMLVYYIPFCALVGLLMLLPDYMAYNHYRQVRKLHDGRIPETVVTVGDTVELADGMMHMSLEYRKITKVLRLKNAYVLMVQRTGVILDPNGFTKGTFEEFKQFLREKRPDLKVPE